jgi:NAD(P)-dependent dehydrogenase (short-subunit alcohol dehydrogenase family)
MPTVLITGCDTGLGVEFARQYAAEGCRVFATCVDPDSAKAARAIKGDVRVLKLDVSDLAAIDALAGEITEPIDILVSNAGLGKHHPGFGSTDYDQWQRILAVNLMGPMRLAEAFVQHVARSSMKVMAFVSSRMGSIALNLTGGSYAYRSSKAGLNAVVKRRARRRRSQRLRHARGDSALQPARDRLVLRVQRYAAALVAVQRVSSYLSQGATVRSYSPVALARWNH